MKIIDKLTHLRDKKIEIYEDNSTRWIPVFAVCSVIALVLYIAYDSFMVIR